MVSCVKVVSSLLRAERTCQACSLLALPLHASTSNAYSVSVRSSFASCNFLNTYMESLISSHYAVHISSKFRRNGHCPSSWEASMDLQQHKSMENTAYKVSCMQCSTSHWLIGSVIECRCTAFLLVIAEHIEQGTLKAPSVSSLPAYESRAGRNILRRAASLASWASTAARKAPSASLPTSVQAGEALWIHWINHMFKRILGLEDFFFASNSIGLLIHTSSGLKVLTCSQCPLQKESTDNLASFTFLILEDDVRQDSITDDDSLAAAMRAKLVKHISLGSFSLFMISLPLCIISFESVCKQQNIPCSDIFVKILPAAISSILYGRYFCPPDSKPAMQWVLKPLHLHGKIEMKKWSSFEQYPDFPFEPWMPAGLHDQFSRHMRRQAYINICPFRIDGKFSLSCF